MKVTVEIFDESLKHVGTHVVAGDYYYEIARELFTITAILGQLYAPDSYDQIQDYAAKNTMSKLKYCFHHICDEPDHTINVKYDSKELTIKFTEHDFIIKIINDLITNGKIEPGYNFTSNGDLLDPYCLLARFVEYKSNLVLVKKHIYPAVDYELDSYPKEFYFTNADGFLFPVQITKEDTLQTALNKADSAYGIHPKSRVIFMSNYLDPTSILSQLRIENCKVPNKLYLYPPEKINIKVEIFKVGTKEIGVIPDVTSVKQIKNYLDIKEDFQFVLYVTDGDYEIIPLSRHKILKDYVINKIVKGDYQALFVPPDFAGMIRSFGK